MEDLIRALQIFAKYTDANHPTTCEHDMLIVNVVAPGTVSDEDKEELQRLGFIPYEDFAFISYRYGSN